MVQNFDKKILELSDVVAIEPALQWVGLLSEEEAKNSQVVVFSREKQLLRLLTTNNFPEKLRLTIENLSKQGFDSEIYYTDVDGFSHALSWYDAIEEDRAKKKKQRDARDRASGKTALDMLHDLYEDRKTFKTSDFVTKFLQLAFQAGASDLHFQVEKDGVTARVRLDGVLHDIVVFSLKDYLQYLSKLKFMSGIKMNVTELPQDGRFSFVTRVHGHDESIDARVNTLPGLYADSIAIRYLQGLGKMQSFGDLGIREDDIRRIESVLKKRYGVIFVTGPTGSGKTTTLYTMLDHINDGSKKIITLENPVEYQLPGIQQSQIDDSKGYSYDIGLRAILRHDPDVILVGETRSRETAQTVVNASLTGHMVFTTLHTNSALDTISRLLSMGVETYLLSPVISLICAQRLVRRVCPHCAEKHEFSGSERMELSQELEKIKKIRSDVKVELDTGHMKGVGCEVCNRTGYLGRTVILEVLPITDSMRELILHGKDRTVFFAEARKHGFLTMKEDGVIKVLQGLTTLDELRKVI